MISDQRVSSVFLGQLPGVVALLIDADVVRVDQLTVFFGPDGELAVILVDTVPADWLDPFAQAAEVPRRHSASRLARSIHTGR